MLVKGRVAADQLQVGAGQRRKRWGKRRVSYFEERRNPLKAKKKELLLKACSINFNSEEYRQELHCKQKLSLCAVSYGGPEEDRSLSR